MGARFVLADMVGLGKTMQLAMSALLMSLFGKKPVLIIGPKPLLWQWQDEMKTLLGMPSAVWNGRQWVDENEIVYPAVGSKGVKHCPRRVGLVSQGPFTARSEAASVLEGLEYECVIVDEAHRARRKNLGKDREADEETDEGPVQRENFRSLSPEERSLLEGFVKILEANQSGDPKYEAVAKLLSKGHAESGSGGWLEKGCIIFSQYYDSVIWLAERLSREAVAGTTIGVYAGAGKSGLMRDGVFQPEDREKIKLMVRSGELRLLIGTDAASEGLNLQRLGTLINLDLPWNPTRLEQRKGRIQRIGQKADVVYVYNMRYQDSVEDRVHEMLSERLKDICDMFGQVPDTLEDVWIALAIGEVEEAKKKIGAIPKKHPFVAKYNQIAQIDWESCAEVLNEVDKLAQLRKGW